MDVVCSRHQGGTRALVNANQASHVDSSLVSVSSARATRVTLSCRACSSVICLGVVGSMCPHNTPTTARWRSRQRRCRGAAWLVLVLAVVASVTRRPAWVHAAAPTITHVALQEAFDTEADAARAFAWADGTATFDAGTVHLPGGAHLASLRTFHGPITVTARVRRDPTASDGCFALRIYGDPGAAAGEGYMFGAGWFGGTAPAAYQAPAETPTFGAYASPDFDEAQFHVYSVALAADGRLTGMIDGAVVVDMDTGGAYMGGTIGTASPSGCVAVDVDWLRVSGGGHVAASQLTYHVQFDGPVPGLQADDFVVVPAPVARAIEGSGPTYDLTVTLAPSVAVCPPQFTASATDESSAGDGGAATYCIAIADAATSYEDATTGCAPYSLATVSSAGINSFVGKLRTDADEYWCVGQLIAVYACSYCVTQMLGWWVVGATVHRLD